MSVTLTCHSRSPNFGSMRLTGSARNVAKARSFLGIPERSVAAKLKKANT